MKQFLRYQISGMVFIAWVVIYCYGSKAGNTLDLLCKNVTSDLDLTWSGLVSALLIGVLIHELAVVLKKWVVAKVNFCICWSGHLHMCASNFFSR